MPLVRSSVSRQIDRLSAGPVTGLDFPSNNVAGSDIQLIWSGANLLPRATHSLIWSVRHRQHTGYYALAWHLPNEGTTWPGNAYCYGTHPYPTTGSFNAAGASTGGTGSTGTVHYYEIAGLGVNDYIASPSTPGPQTTFLVTKDVWVNQGRTSEIVNISGTDYVRHTYYPDLSTPGVFIRQDMLKSELDAISPSSPRFLLGASPWTVSGDTNSEAPSGVIRNVCMFTAALSGADLASEAAGAGNAAVTSAGQASVWYINRNPTPSDVTDKSGAGHSPTWANANRPTLYTG